MTKRTRDERTIVALDVESRQEALALVDELDGVAGMFKIGLQLFVAEGPDLVRKVVDRGQHVFLDLKLHDIPNTVAAAAVQCARLGISILTVHGAGGVEMISAAARALESELGEDKPVLAAVTVLTSMDATALGQTGVHDSPEDQVLRLAALACQAGADALVCSPMEVGKLRRKFGTDLKLITPGVRMPEQETDDQKRVATPAQALADGADWIVVGRYVNRASQPREALMTVIRSLED